MNISFDNSKTECDFLAYKNGKAYGFQVCYELNDMNLKRELYGFELENVMLKRRYCLLTTRRKLMGILKLFPFGNGLCHHLSHNLSAISRTAFESNGQSTKDY